MKTIISEIAGVLCYGMHRCLGVHYLQGCRECCVRAQRFFMFLLALRSVIPVLLPAPVL